MNFFKILANNLREVKRNPVGVARTIKDIIADRIAQEATYKWQRPTPMPTPTAMPTPASRVLGSEPNINQAMDYLRSHVPAGSQFENYYPALQDNRFMDEIRGANNIREGLGNLLLLQGFFESTLGRGGPNIFGVKPQGESRSFGSPYEALKYQLGPNVLGGGVGGSLNILDKQGPVTEPEIRNLYKNYNPNSPYLESGLLPALFGED